MSRARRWRTIRGRLRGIRIRTFCTWIFRLGRCRWRWSNEGSCSRLPIDRGGWRLGSCSFFAMFWGPWRRRRRGRYHIRSRWGCIGWWSWGCVGRCNGWRGRGHTRETRSITHDQSSRRIVSLFRGSPLFFPIGGSVGTRVVRRLAWILGISRVLYLAFLNDGLGVR